MSDDLCVSCKDALERGCFKITRVNRQGADQGEVRACSLRCLIQWAYTYGVKSGVVGVQRLRGALDELLSALRGPPKVK